MPTSDLRARLQRLRLQKVKRELPPSVSPAALKPRPAPSAPARLPGQERVTASGVFQLIENAYPLVYAHGLWPLAAWLERDASITARLVHPEPPADLDLRSLAFVDIETTGLAGGTGTLPFLVGVGTYTGEQFVLRQYFMRDPAEEAGVLNQLVSDLAPAAGWVTFNGRAFDLPILETRLTLNRQHGALGQRPHLDLLPLARRLYRGRLPSCALNDLEKHILRVTREQDDVPGELIPQMYLDYLRTGDASDMRRVIYHNAIDILSMVTLGAHLLDAFATPLETPSPPARVQRSQTPADDPRTPSQNQKPEIVLRLGGWHEDQGRPETAEAAYRLALGSQLDLEDRRLGLTRLAALLKRTNRRAEAAPLWEQLASFSTDDAAPFVELAKFYEWHALDLEQAVAWTKRALKVVAGWPDDWHKAETKTELEHRLERLKGKARE